MRIAFAGTPEVALPSLDALVASSHEVAAVITRPDAAQGRSKRLVASPVAQRAQALGISTLKPASARATEFAEQIAALNLDAVAVVAYGALLPPELLDLVPRGWINLHLSLLPRWRGAAPVQRAIWAGDEVTGATTFRIVRALDAGPVFGSIERPLTSTDTAGDVLADLSQSGASLLVHTFDRVAEGIEPVAQSEQGITIAAKISVDDARIDWTRPADQVSRQIRATSPSPGAWSLLDDQRFKVLAVGDQAAAETPDLALPRDLAPGQLHATKRDLWCGTCDRPLALTRVQAFGKQPMAAADWARGAQDQARTILR